MTGRHDEAGTGGIEGVVLGTIVVVSLTLLGAGAWAVVDARAAATSAAREGARAFVESDARIAAGAARSAVSLTMAGHGRDPSRTTTEVAGAGFGRCRRITVEVRHPVTLVRSPWTGRGAGTIEVRARHSEIVDAHRSGPPGEARC